MKNENISIEDLQVLEEHLIDVKFFTAINDVLEEHIEPKSQILAKSIRDMVKIMCCSHGFCWVTESGRKWVADTISHDIEDDEALFIAKGGYIFPRTPPLFKTYGEWKRHSSAFIPERTDGQSQSSE